MSPTESGMMRYHITMLCGGQSMMLSPSERSKFDTLKVSEIIGDRVLRATKDMVEFMYNDVKLTLYPNSSIMFYHFTDLDVAHTYADEVLEMAKGGRKEA